MPTQTRDYILDPIEQVRTLVLAPTDARTYQLTATFPGGHVARGRTSAVGRRWAYFLCVDQGDNLAVIARTETREAMAARIRREARERSEVSVMRWHFDRPKFVVFARGE